MQAWNVKKLLDWGIDYFSRKKILEPRLSAELLLSAVLNFSRVKLYLNYNYEPTPAELQSFKKLILKRLEHIPVQYILGQAFFRKITLYVDQNVLIPRPETELLVEEALEIAESRAGDQVIQILEVGTGSGAVAISLAAELQQKDFNIIATEKSTKALEVAKKNAQSQLTEEKRSRLHFFCADLVPQTPDFQQAYKGAIDLVISNPPYISQAGFEKLPKQVKDFEPREALVAGPAGSECYQPLFEKVKPLLRKPASHMVIELDSLTAPAAKIAFRAVYGKRPEIKKDYNQKERMLVAEIRAD